MGDAAPLTSSALVSRRDLGFLLYEWLDVERLLGRPRYAEQSHEMINPASQRFLVQQGRRWAANAARWTGFGKLPEELL
jgi:hypothetical protein